MDITHFVHDNQIYGLTKGQASQHRCRSRHRRSNCGHSKWSHKPSTYGSGFGSRFCCQAFSGDKEHLASIMLKLYSTKGIRWWIYFSRVSHSTRLTPFSGTIRESKLSDDYDPTDRLKVMEKAMEWEIVSHWRDLQGRKENIL